MSLVAPCVFFPEGQMLHLRQADLPLFLMRQPCESLRGGRTFHSKDGKAELCGTQAVCPGTQPGMEVELRVSGQ